MDNISKLTSRIQIGNFLDKIKNKLIFLRNVVFCFRDIKNYNHIYYNITGIADNDADQINISLLMKDNFRYQYYEFGKNENIISYNIKNGVKDRYYKIYI